MLIWAEYEKLRDRGLPVPGALDVQIRRSKTRIFSSATLFRSSTYDKSIY